MPQGRPDIGLCPMVVPARNNATPRSFIAWGPSTSVFPRKAVYRMHLVIIYLDIFRRWLLHLPQLTMRLRKRQMPKNCIVCPETELWLADSPSLHWQIYINMTLSFSIAVDFLVASALTYYFTLKRRTSAHARSVL